MPWTSRPADAAALPERYRRFHAEASAFLAPEDLMTDPLRTLAFGTDASFYRLLPRMVVRPRTPEAVQRLLEAARRYRVSLTFRAAGTSLSGQSVTDSVLVLVAGAWRRWEVLDGGERIALEPGVIGAEANASLAPYGRKIGPDPASINAAMVGGIVANNSSGMCCGTAQNSYRTAAAMKLVLADGAFLDTGDAPSRRRFAETHRDLCQGLAAIRDEIAGDDALSRRIREKFRIKNTTGYSLNAFVDFHDPIDILMHLMVGSEGTLGFMAEVTLDTVVEHPCKASALLLFPDIEQAARATMALKGGPVAAAELMDRASLRSVESKPGMPASLAALGPEACALLVETRAADREALGRQTGEVGRLLSSATTLAPVAFTSDKAETERLWDVRRGLFPAVGAARPIGTTVVIEDVAFPMQHLAAGTVELQRLMRAHGYAEGIIFGHALDGNLHFVFTQGFEDPAEIRRYQGLMDEVCRTVVERFDGSLKGEHGTGRNMAPFVELEWGQKAYALMKRLKALLDPDQILNPGVVLNDDAQAHLKNLKPLPRAHEMVDRCTECGFCEPRCPSRDLSTSPRQRIVVQREVARLRRSGQDPARLERLVKDFGWLGEATCAADGLCATACPVAIDTGAFMKTLRAAGHGEEARKAAARQAARYDRFAARVRLGLGAAGAAQAVLGSGLLRGLSSAARALSGGRLPLWNRWTPGPAPAVDFRDVVRGEGRRVVYFPSCIVRMMGPARADPESRAVFEAALSVLGKAGYDVLFPAGLPSLCCGLTFDSKGFPDLADRKARELERALLEKSEGGAIPVLCDTSPCVQRMKKGVDPRLSIHEPAEFVQRFLLDRLRFRRQPGAVAVHPTCSTVKMGLAGGLRAVAEACAETVVVPPRVGCCGFAGDRGYTHPELNASALSELRAGVGGCGEGFSNSRTCEIGLSLHAGIPYRSILFLVDRCTT
ncbi:MAG TPA: FAD-binding and (Fe-S)-binding domain-containing protein [Anaeromyxobacteraceae bacterium]|nr:FAD-binding and (Fe-S)-binding domain-containing protein [Anaeromyxobacteraceae bacterium]